MGALFYPCTYNACTCPASSQQPHDSGSSTCPLLQGCRCKNTGVDCHSLLQGIFLTQGWNLCLLHWRLDSSPLSQQGSPNHVVKSTQTQINKCTHHTDITQPHPDQGEGVWGGNHKQFPETLPFALVQRIMHALMQMQIREPITGNLGLPETEG